MPKKNYEQEAVGAGFSDTDGLAGFLAGRRGLNSLAVPDHFLEEKNRPRFHRWMQGLSAGKELRSAEHRYTIVTGRSKDDEIVQFTRKGWIYARGKLMIQMEKLGVSGDVTVSYHEGGQTVRSVNCGI